MVEESSRRLRSYARRSQKNLRVDAYLRHPRTGRFIAILMIVAAFFFGATGYTFHIAESTGYGGTYFGARPQEIFYFLGKPTGVRSRDGETWRTVEDPTNFPQWLYDRQSVIQLVRFDPETGGLVSFLCRPTEKPGLASCPRTLGVGVGDSEIQLLERLGVPSEERIERGRKVMRYHELDYEFVLENMTVRSIRFTNFQSSIPNRIIRLMRWMLP
jgi:hypothetical protein